MRAPLPKCDDGRGKLGRMALFPCPECGGQVSESAAACPHCGYPLTAASAVGQPSDAMQRMAEQVAADVQAALRSGGLADLEATFGRVGPVVTTYTSTPTPTPVTAEPTRFAGYGYDYRSSWNVFGLPLLAMSQGYDPATGRKRVAKGVVAIGDVAVGLLAIGGAAFGGVTVGGFSVGVVSLGGLAVGLGLAVGGLAIGTVAFGGLAVGVWALGGGAVGLHVVQGTTRH